MSKSAAHWQGVAQQLTESLRLLGEENERLRQTPDAQVILAANKARELEERLESQTRRAGRADSELLELRGAVTAFLYHTGLVKLVELSGVLDEDE